MDKLELSKNGYIFLNNNDVIEILYAKSHQIPIYEIRNIEIIDGILGNKILIIETSNLKLEINLLKCNLKEIITLVNIIRNKLGLPDIKCVVEKNKIVDKTNSVVFNKISKMNRLFKYIIASFFLVFIIFGGGIVRKIKENNNIKLYSSTVIENKVEELFKNLVGKEAKVKLQEDYVADDIGIIEITSLYSSEDYSNIYKFIIETDKLKTNFIGFIYKLNNQYIDTRGYSLEIDDNIVWVDNKDSQNSVTYNPNNTYGEIIEIKNAYGRPFGYKIKEYFVGTEINVEDTTIKYGYDYEYKFKVGDFVEVYGNKVNNTYISNAYVNLFPKETLDSVREKNKIN